LKISGEKNPHLKLSRRDFKRIPNRHGFLEVNISFATKINSQIMVRSTIMFFVIALITGVVGFGIIDGGAAIVARTLFYIAMVLLLVSLLSLRASRSMDV